jgi:hypothetical protein
MRPIGLRRFKSTRGSRGKLQQIQRERSDKRVQRQNFAGLNREERAILMVVSQPLPRLRLSLDFVPSSDPEHPGLLVRDPFRFSDSMLLIPPQLVPCLACFDG